MYYVLVAPTEKACELFYDSVEEGVRAIGIHSASFALKSVYRIFFRFGSPQFILDRAARLFSNYYPEGVLQVSESSSDGCTLQIVKFPESYPILELNIKYWLEGVLELLNKKEKTIEITKAMSRGDSITEYVATWG
ncbi:hypothetical protein HQ585_16370 [candidate division KSB1 bacterium]|nr:hypothetical protein [candidate division KSB1 bacterium]